MTANLAIPLPGSEPPQAERWRPIETAPLYETIDVFVWALDDNGFVDGFRWCDIKLLNRLPQCLGVWRETDSEEGDGYWRRHELSENGQFASHWMPRPRDPEPPTMPEISP